MKSTLINFHIEAPAEIVYAALTTAAAISKWRVPDGMTCEIHEFDPRENGKFRISLTYADPSLQGKSAEHTDTYHGRFEILEARKRVVEVMEFESDDPAMRGEMRSTILLLEKAGGTELKISHENLPSGLKPEENEEGWRLSLAKLNEYCKNRASELS